VIYITRELTLEIGEQSEEDITLWLVSYRQLSTTTQRQTRIFIQALARWCLSQGWLLEIGEEDGLLPEADEPTDPDVGRA